MRKLLSRFYNTPARKREIAAHSLVQSKYIDSKRIWEQRLYALKTPCFVGEILNIAQRNIRDDIFDDLKATHQLKRVRLQRQSDSLRGNIISNYYIFEVPHLVFSARDKSKNRYTLDAYLYPDVRLAEFREKFALARISKDALIKVRDNDKPLSEISISERGKFCGMSLYDNLEQEIFSD
jgi:hypothetical protein